MTLFIIVLTKIKILDHGLKSFSSTHGFLTTSWMMIIAHGHYWRKMMN